MAKSGTTKSDLYQETTDLIIKALETDPGAWQKSWRSAAGQVGRNHVTGKPYSGVNSLVLFVACINRGLSVNRWATFKQAQAKGAKVKKGAKGVALCYFRKLPNKVDGDDEKSGGMVLSRFYVFHISDIDGFDTHVEAEPTNNVVLPGEETLSMRIISQSGATIINGEPAYIPSIDAVRLPEASSFDSSDDYFTTAYHELVHWTGHKSRLDRDMKNKYGDNAYALEELVAELGAAMLSNIAGVNFLSQSSKYLAGWLKALKSDKRAIFTAASKAQAAADFLLEKAGYKDESESEEEVEAA